MKELIRMAELNDEMAEVLREREVLRNEIIELNELLKKQLERG